MKVSLSWTTIPAVIFVLVFGCGDTDNPIGAEIQEPPSEPPTHNVSPILGDWQLQAIVVFKDGVETQRIVGSSVESITLLKLEPDGIFEVVSTVPIEDVAGLDLLEWLEMQHVQEIVVTHRGKYHITGNQIRLNLIVTRVNPKEAPKIDSDFENPRFWYEFGEQRRPLDYFLTEDGTNLELRRETKNNTTIYTVKFLHRRPQTEQSTS